MTREDWRNVNWLDDDERNVIDDDETDESEQLAWLGFEIDDDDDDDA